MRDTKVGDTVAVPRLAGHEPVPGVISAIDKHGTRTVATHNGTVYAVPSELVPTDVALASKRAGELAVGDRVVVFNGAVRTIESIGRSGMVAQGQPARLQIEFAENDKALTMYKRQTTYADELWILAPAEEAPDA